MHIFIAISRRGAYIEKKEKFRMDTAEIYKRYGRYFDLINFLGQKKFSESIIVGKIKRALLETIYSEKKKIDDNLTVPDYVCFIATEMFLQRFQKQIVAGEGFEEFYESENEMTFRCTMRLFLRNPFFLLNKDLVEKLEDKTGKELFKKFSEECYKIFFNDLKPEYIELPDFT